MLCHTPLLFACAHSCCDARQVFCTLARILDSTLHLFCTLAHILDAMPHTLFCLLAHILDATLSRSSARLHTYFIDATLHLFCTLAHILDAMPHTSAVCLHTYLMRR